MTEQKGRKPRKEQRPRLDAVIKHIKQGSYDDDMSQLKGAIDDRQKKRQEAVLGLVKETFGDDYVVTSHQEQFLLKQTVDQPRSIPAAFMTPAQKELEAAEAAARQAEEALRDSLGEDPDSPEIESRSPQIGHVER